MKTLIHRDKGVYIIVILQGPILLIRFQFLFLITPAPKQVT